MSAGTTPAAALVEFAAVSVVFDGNVRALDDVTLAIGKGEIVGLVGESGSGKSTLCRVLVGLTSPTSGSIKVGDRTVGEQIAASPLAFRRRAQMLLQDAVASLSPRMTIRRTLEEPIAIHALPRAEALLLAARVRLRPILMTTLAMIFGMVPLAFALSEGAEQRAPMGQAVIGGVITSSLLTLVVVPVVYCYMDDLANWARRKWQGTPATPVDATPKIQGLS